MHDLFPTKPPTPHPVEKERPEALATVGLRAAPKSVGAAGHVVAQKFTPSFAATGRRLVTIEDSVKVDLGLAGTMLQGLELLGENSSGPLVESSPCKCLSYSGSAACFFEYFA